MIAALIVWLIVLVVFLLAYSFIEFAKWRCSQVDDLKGENAPEKEHQNP